MSLIASAKSGGGFDAIPEGVYVATCIWVIDLGDQQSKLYRNIQHKVLIGWELPEEKIEINGEQKPRMISNTYTLSLNEKALLRNHLESWRGKAFTEEELDGFDVSKIIGTSCQLQVLHSKSGDKTYVNVKSVMSLPKGMPVPVPENDIICFGIEDRDSLDKIVNFPAWVQEKIRSSITYEKLTSQDNAESGRVLFEDVPADEKMPWDD